jgi:ATP-binding cassette subfamily C (CFTR/MRP) protein 4
LLEEAGLEGLLTRKELKGEGESDLESVYITENGGNLSSGEKQLICICRAILRKNKVVLLDEATANIDLLTEQRIQKLIEEEFGECTVITIAHRLQTIMKSDRVLVVEDGRCVEFD